MPVRCTRAEELDGHSASGTSVSMTTRIQKNLGRKKQILMTKVMKVDGEWKRRWGSGKGKTEEVNKGLLGRPLSEDGDLKQEGRVGLNVRDT